MSRLEIQGAVPAPHTILGVLDEQAAIAARQARDVIRTELHEQTPRSTRGGAHLQEQVTASARKTKTGYQVTATFGRRAHGSATAAQVARWVTRGTGLYRSTPGGTKHRIRANRKLRRMNLGNGVLRWSVAGQHPNPFVQRAREAAHDRATEALRAGAIRAAKILRGQDA